MKFSICLKACCCTPVLVFVGAVFLASSAAGQTITTVAGGYVGDGSQATAAAFAVPEFAVMDQRGNLIISDLVSCNRSSFTKSFDLV
jgi:hypothetical protein